MAASRRSRQGRVALPEGVTVNPSLGSVWRGAREREYARRDDRFDSGGGVSQRIEDRHRRSRNAVVDAEDQRVRCLSPSRTKTRSAPCLRCMSLSKNPETGVIIKLAGKVAPDPVTGQLVTIFENMPQLPFDHFNLHFRQGRASPLITPPTCGTYTTQADI